MKVVLIAAPVKIDCRSAVWPGLMFWNRSHCSGDRHDQDVTIWNICDRSRSSEEIHHVKWTIVDTCRFLSDLRHDILWRPLACGRFARREQKQPSALDKQSSGNLSEQVARSGGVIELPGNIDPKIQEAPPDTPEKMPMVPPPGEPGRNPSVKPR